MLTKNNVRKEKNIFVEAMHYSSLAFANLQSYTIDQFLTAELYFVNIQIPNSLFTSGLSVWMVTDLLLLFW